VANGSSYLFSKKCYLLTAEKIFSFFFSKNKLIKVTQTDDVFPHKLLTISPLNPHQSASGLSFFTMMDSIFCPFFSAAIHRRLALIERDMACYRIDNEYENNYHADNHL